MKKALEVLQVNKGYSEFKLNDINFVLPEGCIMGIIGANGAGKTTLIKSILGLTSSNGEVLIFGKNKAELTAADKANIGVVFDENSLPERLKVKQINMIFKKIYSNWNEKKFFGLLQELQIPDNIAIAKMSRGNKIKLNLVVALSHEPKLLILDEITGTLDPVTREDVLKIFLEFVEDESRSILFSSHITIDLEKIADFITLINKGNIIFSKEKEDLISNYRIVKCKKKQFEEIDKKNIIVFRKEENSVELIVKTNALDAFNQDGMIVEVPAIADFMTIFAKGEMV